MERKFCPALFRRDGGLRMCSVVSSTLLHTFREFTVPLIGSVHMRWYKPWMIEASIDFFPVYAKCLGNEYDIADLYLPGVEHESSRENNDCTVQRHHYLQAKFHTHTSDISEVL